MEYISTRGFGPVSYTQALLAGLAPDGGLFVPRAYPQFSPETLARFATMTYRQIAVEVMAPFMAPDFTPAQIARFVDKAYATFSDGEVTPLTHLAEGTWLLELFHGPTLAFKDIALQFLGQVMAHVLAERDAHAVVIGATSGDTGPAALAGLAGMARVQVFMTFPAGRTSDVQRRQMTTLNQPNLHPIAVEGTFDDCQHMVKTLLADKALRAELPLTAVNSISWARLLPQLVYYFYAWSRLQGAGNVLHVAVPTGNFGDIFAGYVAKMCGLPLGRLILATNSNDILARFINDGDYSLRPVVPTLSPSMDILVASNFERLLFDLLGRDGARTAEVMAHFATHGNLPALPPAALPHLRTLFAAHQVSDAETLQVIRRTHADTGKVIDPHTAVGLEAAQHHAALRPVVVLATAHPAKFPRAIEQATGIIPALPAHLAGLLQRAEVYDTIAADAKTLRAYIKAHVKDQTHVQ